ncbi:putative serine protease F56F10.1 [Aphelenchoides besseyi]|nr:putative serine protease F56F10.1 [Aphelenchoides besseyi]
MLITVLFSALVALAHGSQYGYQTEYQRYFQWQDQKALQGIDSLTIERKFDQRLDHFNKHDNRTFPQRYFENFRYYRSCGPIFLTVGGEAAVQPTTVADPRMITTILARQFGGALISLEHRYYGESFPTTNRSNFEFLSSRQAIEDLANFIQTITEQYRLMRPRYILYGCSYPASLAAWMRSRYPLLSIGAIAVSAPLEVKMNFEGITLIDSYYKAAVSDAIWRISENCAARLRDAFQLLNAEMQIQDNWPRVASELGVQTANTTVPVEYDTEAAHSAITTNFLFALGGHVQNKPSENFRNEICRDIVLDMRRPLLQMLGNVGKIESVPEYGINAWTYQLCNEFGWFVISSNSNATSKRTFWPDLFLFNLTVDRASEFCRYSLGEDYATNNINKRVQATQEYYGSMQQLNTTNVVYVVGENDPWGPLQMQPQYLKPGNLLVTVKGEKCSRAACPTVRENSSVFCTTDHLLSDDTQLTVLAATLRGLRTFETRNQ